MSNIPNNIKKMWEEAANLKEGLMKSGPINSAGKHEAGLLANAHKQGRKLTDQEHAALRQHARNDSAANAKIAKDKM